MSEPHRILITGASGFVGAHLVRRLRELLPEAQLFLTDHTAGNPGGGQQLDVSNADAADRVMSSVRPTALVHLAAISAVTASYATPRKTWEVNTLGTLNILNALRQHAPTCHLLFISSAEVYGRSTFSGLAATESTLLQPANPYAVTKAAADLMVQEECGRGLKATILRPFNHFGPGQKSTFVIPSFCEQIAKIETGQQPPLLKVGSLDDERDFLDVNDVVDLYASVIQRGHELESGIVLNVASGESRRIGSLLEILRTMSKAHFSVEVDPERIRPNRVPRIVGDASKASALLDWAPQRPIETTLLKTLKFWRTQL